jgi:adenosylmethionine-8-amino-7-oxononanoate aminotransferase
MSPTAEVDSDTSTDASAKKHSSLLVRTSWRPPVGVSAEGIFITVDDGRRLIDAVGGAAVACIGGNHPVVMQAIKNQVDKVSCTPHFSQHLVIELIIIVDVYSMQLSNEPAEALARKLVNTSNGAFTLCGFASGGLPSNIHKEINFKLMAPQVQRLWMGSSSSPDR